MYLFLRNIIFRLLMGKIAFNKHFKFKIYMSQRKSVGGGGFQPPTPPPPLQPPKFANAGITVVQV